MTLEEAVETPVDAPPSGSGPQTFGEGDEHFGNPNIPRSPAGSGGGSWGRTKSVEDTPWRLRRGDYPNPESRIPNNPESRIPNPESGTPEPYTEHPTSHTLNPVIQTLNPTPGGVGFSVTGAPRS